MIIVFKVENDTFATKTVSGTVGEKISINKPLLLPNPDANWVYKGQDNEAADGDATGETTGEAGEEVAGKVNTIESGWEYIIPEGTGDITLEFGL